MRYRRSDIAGGTYFFTVNLCDRSQQLLVEHVERLRLSVARVKAHHPFAIEAMVVLPDHLHAIWTLPPNDRDYATRWMLIKAGFSRGIDKNEAVNASRQVKRERGIWQRRYWEHLIRDDNDYARHVDYIHFNPVKHGYVERASDWPFSSIHKHIGNGMLNRDWVANRRATVLTVSGDYDSLSTLVLLGIAALSPTYSIVLSWGCCSQAHQRPYGV